jgi:hypothetical protein
VCWRRAADAGFSPAATGGKAEAAMAEIRRLDPDADLAFVSLDQADIRFGLARQRRERRTL